LPTPLLLLLCLAFLPTHVAAAPRAADDLEAWAADLVAPADGRSGARDDIVRRWMERIAQQPGHPLVEATLQLIEATRHDLDDPLLARQALLQLDDQGMSPAARRLLFRLQGAALAADGKAGPDSPDLFPAQLRELAVLGPLGPPDDPLAAGLDPAFVAQPDFAGQHVSPWGPVRWRPLRRPSFQQGVRPSMVIVEERGWVVLAGAFDVPGGGPAWLEIDLGSAAGASVDGAPGAVWSFGGSDFASLPPATRFSFVLNDGPLEEFDMLDGERSGRLWRGVVLRDGVNRLLVRLPTSLDTPLSISCHAPDGGLLPGLHPALPDSSLGAAVEGSPPTGFGDSASMLAALESPGPAAQALAGLLALLDHRPAEGYDLLERAATRAAEGPQREALDALLAGVTAQARHLPPAWSRTRTRELVESVLARDPQHLAMGLALADILDREDADVQALGLLEQLGATHPNQCRSLIELSRVARGMQLEVSADRALEEAVARKPRSPLALNLLAQQHGRLGLDTRASVLRDLARRARGLNAEMLEEIGREHGRAGDFEAAHEAWAESLLRGPDPLRRLEHADWLVDIGALDEADAGLAELAEEHAGWSPPVRRRADIARLQGDGERERRLLEEVVRREPTHRPARERLKELGVPDPIEQLQDMFLVDRADVVAAYDETGRRDSVVRLLDEAVVKVYADGSMETITHEIVQVRDLAACEREGELRLPGEVLAVARLARTPGERDYEPVRVADSYVMPRLQPGDLIEREFRTRDGSPTLVVRPGRWFFRSVDEPFVVSRYVIAFPADMPLRFESGRFDGLHEVHEVGGDVVHVFEMRDQPRVQLEPGAPPGHWFLPWVEFGMDEDLTTRAANLRALVAPCTWVTPLMRATAASATAGAAGQEAAARALHAFVEKAIDRREDAFTPAEGILRSRTGSATVLYATLLEAAGIAHDIVLSRAVSPGGDPEPDPPFAERNSFRGRPLVRVRPDDGEPAWCDLSLRGLPYGVLMGDAPGAPALAAESGETLAEPVGAEGDRPGVETRLEVRVAADGSALVEGRLGYLGGMGWAAAAELRDAPAVQHRRIVEAAAASVLPGIALETWGIDGLDGSQRVAFRFAGRVARFLDQDGRRPLPLSSLDLAGGLAVEGSRHLPFLQSAVNEEHSTIVLLLPAGHELVDAPPGLHAECEGFHYAMDLTPKQASAADDGQGWVLERAFRVMPFSVPAESYAELTRFAQRVDEAESAWLQVRPSDEAAAGTRR